MRIQVSYIHSTTVVREFTVDEIWEVARRFDYPGVMRLMESCMTDPERMLTTPELDQVERMLNLEEGNIPDLVDDASDFIVEGMIP